MTADKIFISESYETPASCVSVMPWAGHRADGAVVGAGPPTPLVADCGGTETLHTTLCPVPISSVSTPAVGGTALASPDQFTDATPATTVAPCGLKRCSSGG